MGGEEQSKGSKLHIIIAIVIGIEIIALLGIFGFFVINKSDSNKSETASAPITNSTSSDTPATNNSPVTETSATKTTPTPTPIPTPTPVVTIQHTVDGITFEIPDKFKNTNGDFKSDYSQLYFFSKKIPGFWAIYMVAPDSEIDNYADTYVTQYFPGAKREEADDTTVAGCEGRKYKYSANYNGESSILVANIVVSPSKDGVVAAIFLTPEKNSELADYISIIESAK